MIRFGVSPFATTRAGALAVARTAIAGGIDTLWLGDGLLASDDFPGWSGALEPFTELAWLAGATGPARIGLTAAVLPLRDVVYVAKQAASLDVITEGGFVLVVAPGFWDREFAFRGIPIDERATRFDDAVGALRALWRGEPYDGRFHQVPAGDVSPFQLRRCARTSAGETVFSQTYEEHERGVQQFQQWCSDHPGYDGC